MLKKEAIVTKLPVPEGAIAQHVIVLGKTRSGKSSKIRLLVEGLLDAAKPVCIIDPGVRHILTDSDIPRGLISDFVVLSLADDISTGEEAAHTGFPLETRIGDNPYAVLSNYDRST